MSEECNCKTSDVVRMAIRAHNQHKGVCPKCGQSWTKNESRSISVLVTAPEAASGETNVQD